MRRWWGPRRRAGGVLRTPVTDGAALDTRTMRSLHALVIAAMAASVALAHTVQSRREEVAADLQRGETRP